MPPLRDHLEDVEELCNAFLAEFSRPHHPSPGISREAISCLRQYDFPGNVRELRNLMVRASVLCKNPEITLADLPTEITSQAEENVFDSSLSGVLARAERQCLKNALAKSQGNRTKASELLGISRKNLWEKLKNHNIT